MTHRDKILKVMAASTTGMTYEGISKATRLAGNAIARRLPEMERDGLVKRAVKPGKTSHNRSAILWHITSKGTSSIKKGKK